MERFDVRNDWLSAKYAPMSVGRKRASQRQLIGACLLLDYGERLIGARLSAMQPFDQARPSDAGLGPNAG